MLPFGEGRRCCRCAVGSSSSSVDANVSGRVVWLGV